MKLPHLLAAALLAGLAFASNANATAIDFVSSTAGSLSTKSSYDIADAGMANTFDKFSGTLAGNSKLTITYSYTGPTPYFLNVTASAAGGSELAQASASTSNLWGPSPTSTQPLSSLPVIVTAGFSSDGPVGMTVIKNRSSSAISFSSIFTAAVFSRDSGNTHVSYILSSIPLPPAFILFGSGLLALAGFGMHKKARGQL